MPDILKPWKPYGHAQMSLRRLIQIRAEEANRFVEVLDEEERNALIRGLRKLLSQP